MFAYLRQPGTREYYAASAARTESMWGPSEPVMVKGLRRRDDVLQRRRWTRLGVSVEIEHAR